VGLIEQTVYPDPVREPEITQARADRFVAQEIAMPVLGLEHVNIRTPEPARTIAFFRDVLQMKVGPSPRSSSMENGAWVFNADDVAIVHIARVGFAYPSDEKMPFKESRGSGAVHHVALKCTSFADTMERLSAAGVEFYENNMSQLKLRQIFVSDPNGILFELNFSNDIT
jgi:catechol 2,3-dioxygenase-like lactoylglutathione lyase family enzyme